MAKVKDKLTQKKMKILISDSIGKISAIITSAKNPIAVMTLAHGAGAGMEHPFMESLAISLAESGVSVVRFNFPFTEGAKKRPDPPTVAEKTIEKVVEKAHELFPDLPLFASGKSFGGRMTSQRLSKECPTYLKGIAFYGFPLHAPGKAGVERADHLSNLAVPLLFLQGTRDALADIKLMRKVAKKLSISTLIELEGADHSFKRGKGWIIEELVKHTILWIDEVIA